MSYPSATYFGTSISAAVAAQVGAEVDGVIGELIQYAGVGGAAVAALFILGKAYRQRSAVQDGTIESLKVEIDRLKEELGELQQR